MARMTTAEVLRLTPKLIKDIQKQVRPNHSWKVSNLISSAANPTLPIVTKLFELAIDKEIDVSPKAHETMRQSEEIWNTY